MPGIDQISIGQFIAFLLALLFFLAGILYKNVDKYFEYEKKIKALEMEIEFLRPYKIILQELGEEQIRYRLRSSTRNDNTKDKEKLV